MNSTLSNPFSTNRPRYTPPQGSRTLLNALRAAREFGDLTVEDCRALIHNTSQERTTWQNLYAARESVAFRQAFPRD